MLRSVVFVLAVSMAPALALAVSPDEATSLRDLQKQATSLGEQMVCLGPNAAGIDQQTREGLRKSVAASIDSLAARIREHVTRFPGGIPVETPDGVFLATSLRISTDMVFATLQGCPKK